MAPRLSATAKKRAHGHPGTCGNAPSATPVPAAPAPVAMISPQEQEFRAKLKELRDHLTKNADNVGAKFPEEARKMHYGEIDHRSIYGVATPRKQQSSPRKASNSIRSRRLPDERTDWSSASVLSSPRGRDDDTN